MYLFPDKLKYGLSALSRRIPMLYIFQDGKTTSHHTGSKLPFITGRVVTFQADGHELQAITTALANSDDFKDQCRGDCKYDCCKGSKRDQHQHPCSCD